MNKNDGGFAFPMPYSDAGVLAECGMSLRDYFAAHAPARNEIPALFVEQFADRITGNAGAGGRRPMTAPEMALCSAEWRYVIADAMLKARES